MSAAPKGGSGGTSSGDLFGGQVLSFSENSPPYAENDHYVAVYNSELFVPAEEGLLINDEDYDGPSPLTAIPSAPPPGVPAGPLYGDVTIYDDGSFLYVPDPGFVGQDYFYYAASDGLDDSGPTYVDIPIIRPSVNVLVDSNQDETLDENDESVEMNGLGFVFGVNDDDTNQNFLHDNDPADAPFRDANENPIWDNLHEAQVSYDMNNDYAPAPDMEGFQITFNVGSNVNVWYEPSKENEISNAIFVFDEYNTPRWNTLALPDTVYLEGIIPGTTVFALAMFNAEADGINNDAANMTPIKVDIDIDSDNSGAINEGEVPNKTEDATEMGLAGKLIRYNAGDDDDNQNGQPDRMDAAPFKDAAGDPVQDDDLVPATISVDADGANIDGYTVTLSAGAKVKLWKTQDKQALPLTYTIGTDFTNGMTIYVEGFDPGQDTVSVALAPPGGENVIPVHNDSVRVTLVLINLTAYRPQTEGPGYGSPFAKAVVPWQKEEGPGVGIRRNGEDDNDNNLADNTEASVTNEDDLIEVKFEYNPTWFSGVGGLPPGIEYRLKRTNDAINLWQHSSKTTSSYLSETSANEVTYNPVGGTHFTAWVEWASLDANDTSANLEFSVWDITDLSNKKKIFFDTLKFYAFSSVLISLGGEFEPPPDDPIVGQGIFQVAIDEYRNGYDAHMYDEDVVTTDGSGRAFDEVVEAIQKRKVTEVALIGYSHGGGSVWDLANRLNENRQNIGTFSISFTSYVDAVENEDFNPLSEVRLPPSTLFHTNQYQTTGLVVDGEPTNMGGTSGDNLNRDNLGVNHQTIDDHQTVIDFVKARIEQKVNR